MRKRVAGGKNKSTDGVRKPCLWSGNFWSSGLAASQDVRRMMGDQLGEAGGCTLRLWWTRIRCFIVVGNGESLNLEIASNILLLEKCFHRHDYIFNLDHNPPREAGQDSPMRKKVLGSKEPHTGSFKISCFCPL